MTKMLRFAIGMGIFSAVTMVQSVFASGYCIQNIETGRYLSDVGNKLWARCSTGETWNIYGSGEGYCLQNIHTQGFLSDNVQHYHQCSTGEKWAIEKQRNGGACLRNLYTGQYLSNNMQQWSRQCMYSEKWQIVKK